jgi:hypothetical protein
LIVGRVSRRQAGDLALGGVPEPNTSWIERSRSMTPARIARSMTDSIGKARTVAPGRGEMSTMPSNCSDCIASRTGARLTAKRRISSGSVGR